MAKPPKKHEVRLTGPAQRDLSIVMEWTVQEFGARSAPRYDASIKQALKDIAADPERPGSMERPEIMIEGARTYHLSFNRRRVSRPGVKEPRHFLLYRRRGEGKSRWSASFTMAATCSDTFPKTTAVRTLSRIDALAASPVYALG